MLAQSDQISSQTVSAAHGRKQPERLSGRAASGSLASAAALLIFCGAGLFAGCTIPSDCGDLDYPTYGGAWQRTRRDAGRVGSVFDPAGARAAVLTDRNAAAQADEARGPAESIHSTPPGRPSTDSDQLDPEEVPASPSDRSDRDRLRSLELQEIDVEPGTPAPPDLH